MKRILLFAVMLLSLTLVAPSAVQAGAKRDARVAYVLKNLRLKSDVQEKFKPLLEAFLKELSDVKDPYEDLKDELQDAIDTNKLTAAQCDKLFELKQKQEEQEPAVLRKWYAKFKTVLTTQQAYKAMKLSDDKLK
jgi:Skp family chaperone for outer membrane proteins